MDDEIGKNRDGGRLPRWWWWVIAGAVLGVVLRIVFGALPKSMEGPMSIGFMAGTPFVVGALTVIGAPPERRTVLFLIFAPWAGIGLMLLGCAITLLEGSICLALMAPLFLVLASLGGVLMGVALHFVPGASSRMSAVAVLPLLMLVGEGHAPLPVRHVELRRAVVVDAPPATIWNEILTARSIEPDELPLSLTHMIGVPRPLEGINVRTEEEEVRFSRWERGVNFRGFVTARKENESITWRYVFDDRSFPEGSMDEHVAIGGRYFDLRDTTFHLMPEPDGGTRLEIVAHYRVSTSINAYAVPVAAILGRDFLDTILGLYKHRSESAARDGMRVRG
jgi:hypothetical protein